jgi:hypothetical protein
VYIIFRQKTSRERPAERPKHRWEYNNEMKVREESVNWRGSRDEP